MTVETNVQVIKEKSDYEYMYKTYNHNKRDDVTDSLFFCGYIRNFRCDCGNRKFTELQCKLFAVSSHVVIQTLFTYIQQEQSSVLRIH